MHALLILEMPMIEVYITNVYKREEFRHRSFVSRAVEGVICGLASPGYSLALKALAEMI